MRTRLIIGGALVALWLIGAFWAIPALIRSAYAGTSLPMLNRLISGQAHTPLATYLGEWRLFASNVTWAIAILAVLTAIVVPLVRRMRRVEPDAGADPYPGNAREVLLLTAWIGIVAGLAEALNAIVRHRIRHMPTGDVVWAEVWWVTPLAAVVTLGLLALILLAAHRLLPARIRVLRFLVPLFAGLALYSLGMAMRVGLHDAALLILAAGIGFAALRAVTAHPGAIRWLVRRTTPWMAGALVMLAILIPPSRRVAEWIAMSGQPAPPPNAPNVLIIIWDTARALSLSLYGYERETTPELERLAQRGATFERAFATSSWSLPSHASMYTGRYPHEMTVGRQTPLNDRHPTLAEQLAALGYATGGFSANLFYGSADYGIARGFAWYEARPGLHPMVIAHTWWLSRETLRAIQYRVGYRQHMLRWRAGKVNQSLLSWLDRHEDRPFFAVVNQFDAHEPYLPPSPFGVAFADSQPRYWFSDEEDHLTPEVLSNLRDAYDGSIRYLDHELGVLLRTLDARDDLDNTVVILTSDHGEEFGEHGGDTFGHARSAYATSLLVPLVVVFPARVPAGVRVPDPVSIRDIPATVMDIVDAGGTHPFPGISLVRYAEGTVTAAERAEPRLAAVAKHPWGGREDKWPAARSDLFSLAVDTVHYLVHGDEELLFDIRRDPFEQRNLASQPDVAPRLARLRFVLDSMVRAEDGTRRVRAIH